MKKFITILITIVYVLSATYCASANNGKLQLPTISKEEAINIARTYITINSADKLDELNLNDSYTIKYSKSPPYGYNITFNRMINNIPYGADGIYLFVDGNSGGIINYSENFSNDIIPTASSSLIDKNIAEEKFKSSMGLELRYNKYIDGKNAVAYLTYTAKEDFVVNAKTGNIIPISYKLPTNGYFDITHMSEKTSGTAYFDSSVLSTSEADKIARGISEFEIDDKYNPVSANYLRSHDGTYLITISYTSGNHAKTVTLNAVNGVPVEYENSSTDIVGITSDQSDKINSFARKYYADYLDNMIKFQSSTHDHTVTLYERQINGIPYKSNGLYICFNNYGKLENLSFAWDNIDFPSADNILPAEKIYEIFFKKCGLELSYHKRTTNEITPIYKKSSKGTGIFDAKRGMQLNYDGTNFNSEQNYNYLDIDSHYASHAASKLFDCDIYASSGNVHLRDYITQQEYLLLISELISGTKPILNTTGILSKDQRDMLYTYMIENGVISNSEINYTGYITRADAVKYLICVLGYSEVASVPEIFIKHFSDTDKIPQHMLGYVELARSLGIINGDTDNCFRPNDYLSNGDSLIMLYNYLKS